MKKRSELTLCFCFICFVFLLCSHSEFVSAGFAEGLQLWYNQLVPVLLPFLLLSGLFLSMLDPEHPNRVVCILLVFICGLFCGFPVGAIAIRKMHQKNVINKRFAQAVLPLCNNVSPMFLIGYIYHPCLEDTLSLLPFLCIIYLPQLAYACFFYITSCVIEAIHKRNHISSFKHRQRENLRQDEVAASGTYDSVIEDSIRTITIIGVYIAVFSVFYECVLRLSSSSYLQTAACFLEITKGVSKLAASRMAEAKKAALLLSLTAFGGASSLLQSIHVLKDTDLSFCNYMFGKIICSVSVFFVCNLFYLII